MKPFAKTAARANNGYALIIVIVFFGVSMTILGGALSWVSTTSRLSERNNRLQEATYAAEAATEKVLSSLLMDFKVGGEARVWANLSSYRDLIPTSGENAYWEGYAFNNASGSRDQTYVQRLTTLSYQPLESQYAGLYGYASNYRIVSNAKSQTDANLPIAAVQQDVQLATIPLFQFAIFYNMYLDLNPGEAMEVRGRVHANGPIYTGPGGSLTFYGPVTSTDINRKNRHPNDPSYVANANPSVTYASGKETNVATLAMPIGTNNNPDAVWDVLAAPPASETTNAAMSKERFYNKAEMLIIVTNNEVQVQVKQPFGIPSTNLPWSSVQYFINTNVSFTDLRENKTMKTTEIDLAKFRTFVATNSTVASILGYDTPPNVVYVADNRTTTSSQLTAVRLVNGSTLPSRGLTVCTPNPLYVKGNYNCPNSTHLNTTNTTQALPAALISDALTVLSQKWNDANSGGALSTRTPTNTTVNAAILTGNVPWAPPTTPTSYYSGGAQNLTRYLENWSSSTTVTYNSSLVCMFASKKATGLFRQSGDYYNIPTRELYFDNNFTDPTRLPPGTPQMTALIRGKWVNPPPGTTTYAAN